MQYPMVKFNEKHFGDVAFITPVRPTILELDPNLCKNGSQSNQKLRHLTFHDGIEFCDFENPPNRRFVQIRRIR